jgi:hypothetical protein
MRPNLPKLYHIVDLSFIFQNKNELIICWCWLMWCRCAWFFHANASSELRTEITDPDVHTYTCQRKKMILHWSLALSWCAIVSGRNQATNLLGYERSSWVRRDYRLPPLLVLESNVVLWKVIHAFIASAMAGAPCHVTWHSMIGSLNFIGNQAIDPWQTQEQCTVVASCWKVVT